MNTEPALVIGAVMAVLAVLVGFGLDVTEEQMALIAAALVAVGAVFTRSKVTPSGPSTLS